MMIRPDVRISGKSTSDLLEAVRSEFLNEVVVSGTDHVHDCLTFNDLKLYVVVSVS